MNFITNLASTKTNFMSREENRVQKRKCTWFELFRERTEIRIEPSEHCSAPRTHPNVRGRKREGEIKANG